MSCSGIYIELFHPELSVYMQTQPIHLTKASIYTRGHIYHTDWQVVSRSVPPYLGSPEEEHVRS